MFEKIPPELIFLIIGLLGAVVHAFKQLTDKKESGKIPTWQDFIVYVTYGGFAAVMFGLASMWVFDDQIAQWFFTGMGAFTGFAGLNALSVWALEKIGIKNK